MNSDEPIVFVVDDDYRVREVLSSLIAFVGLRVVAFGSAAEFLESGWPGGASGPLASTGSLPSAASALGRAAAAQGILLLPRRVGNRPGAMDSARITCRRVFSCSQEK
jgi:hypothetical protein